MRSETKNSLLGFTLVELTMVISVLVILSASVFFVEDIAKRNGEAKDAKRLQDLIAIAQALELYQIDNGVLPDSFASANIGDGHKVVLCTSSASLTCDDWTESCLVVDDTDFLGKYLDALPIDPEKSSDSDTGYYITRTGNMMTFGACETYGASGITHIAKASLPAYVSTCGDWLVEGTEVCDDGDTFSEGCGNGVIETNGTYCNSTCSAVIVVGVSEVCDSLLIDSCWDSSSSQNLYSGSYVGGTGCKAPKTHCNAACDYCSAGCF